MRPNRLIEDTSFLTLQYISIEKMRKWMWNDRSGLARDERERKSSWKKNIQRMKNSVIIIYKMVEGRNRSTCLATTFQYIHCSAKVWVHPMKKHYVKDLHVIDLIDQKSTKMVDSKHQCHNVLIQHHRVAFTIKLPNWPPIKIWFLSGFI